MIFDVKFPPNEVYLLFMASKTIREWICESISGGETKRNASANVLTTLSLEDWVSPAFEVFVKWTKQPSATIPEDSDLDVNPVENHLKLWELGRKLQAPAFQNAVMKNMIYLTDFFEQVTAADMSWLHSRIADDADFKSFDDHKMFKFCLDAVSFDAPEELWKDLIRQGGDLAVMVAEDVIEDYTDDHGNLSARSRDIDPTNPSNIHWYLEAEGAQHAKALEDDGEDSDINTDETPEDSDFEDFRSSVADEVYESMEDDEDEPPAKYKKKWVAPLVDDDHF